MQVEGLSKQQLLDEIERFLKDPHRGISKSLFADLCGYSQGHLENVFIIKKDPLTENCQIRVNRAYQQWKAGLVKIMKRPDNTRYIAFRKEPKPVFMPHTGLKWTKEGFKINVGLRNRHDYSNTPLDEQMKG